MTNPITEQDVLAAQESWGEAIVAIGEAENPEAEAQSTLDTLYAYDFSTVLFKPTLASEVPFRGTEEEALSYFVGGIISEDQGFALAPFTDVRFENEGIITYDDTATSMGEYFFTQTDGSEIKVEYSFGYVRDENGELKINLQHSSLPYVNEEPAETDTSEPSTEDSEDLVAFEFEANGQIAGFKATGEFSYDANQVDESGIVREEDLVSFDISFFDPEGDLLRTYEDNHLTFPEFNFAYDTNTGELLQDGAFMGEEGFNFGEKTAIGEDEFAGLNLFSRPELNPFGEVPPPHYHFDDWSDEFGFPVAFGTHEDVSFFTQTTQQLLDTGRVGETYIDDIQDSLDETGQRIVVTTVEDTAPSFAPVFGSIDDDTIEVEGSNQLIFAGDLNDLVDASIGEGNNRIYAGSGDDILILGESDRIFGSAGDDQFYVTSGGDNIITGGAGADQFWIANAEIPDAANIITDFTSGEDVIGIAGLGIGFTDVSITDLEGDALISANDSELAILQGVDASVLSESDFAFA
ncbi:MAG: hypothetical protein AAF383_08095 [Cyanobacteria bacterium P01_A01_bin.83]